MTAAILGAPEAVRDEIDLKRQASSRLSGKSYDFIHAFFNSPAELANQFGEIRDHLEQNGALWISWKKKSADPRGDLNENVVRKIGLASGLVDVKVCAVDESWSALKFVYRKSDRSSDRPKDRRLA